MNNGRRIMAPAADKENAVANSHRPWAALTTTASNKIMAPHQHQHQAQVPKTLTAREGVTTAASKNKRIAVGRSGRGPGLALCADRNGGAPSSAPSSTAAATAPGTRKRQGDETADTSNTSCDSGSSTSSDFTGPQRVRVSNNNIASDISLSFWSRPASTPDGSGRLDSKTASRAARSERAPAATNTPVHRQQPRRAVSREPSTAERDVIASSRGGAHVTASTRKRARVEAAPPVAKTTTEATSAQARHQALKWKSGVGTSGRRGDGGSVTHAGALDERVVKDCRQAPAPAPTPASSGASRTAAVDSSRLKSPFGADISHILSWKPGPRPGSADAITATTAAVAGSIARAAASFKGKDEGGGGSAAGERQQQQQQRRNTSSATSSKQEPTVARASAGGSSAGGSSAISSTTVAGGDDVLRRTHAGVTVEETALGAAFAPGASVDPTHANDMAPVATSTAARPKITSSSFEALRVRVVKKGDDGDGGHGDMEDDSDDSFEAYDEEIRRRSSADATSAPPRPGAIGSRSSSVPAAATPPVLHPHASITATGTAGRGGAGVVPATAATVVAAASAPAPGSLPTDGSATVSGGLSVEGGTGGGDSGDGGRGHRLAATSARRPFGETVGGEPTRLSTTPHERTSTSSSTSSAVGWNRGGLGAAGAGVASVMSRVPEEGEEDMSLTVGAGSKAPYIIAADSRVSGGPRHGSAAGGDGGGGGGASGAFQTTGSATGGRADPSLSLGLEQTDSSDQASGLSTGVGAGGGVGHDRASISGLLGGGSMDGSSLGVAPVGGKPGKAVAFAQGASSHGWSEVMVNGVRYLKTAQIGRGGSSEVFRVVAPDCQMMALKVVKVDNRVENAQALIDSYSNEIELLKKLQGNRFIITLENSEVDRHRGLISIVLELGETDLDRLMRQYKANVGSMKVDPATSDLFPGGLDANFVRVIWQQMLKAVQAMHDQRVVHGDLKPANFVFVKGSLKLIDFGIAKAISNDTINISRDSRLGTMNYMCPEAFEDTGKGELDPATGRQTPVIKQGRASDIWSLGCILYQMSHGKTPFSHLSMVPKIRAITNPGHVIAIADLEDRYLAETLRACLKRDPSERATIGGAGGLLSHPYLHPIAARASLETDFNAKLEAANELAEARINAADARVDARIAELEREADARVKERVVAVERDIYSRHEGAVASAVAAAVAAEQARQAAGLSIAKSALKHIIATTVRVLNADKSVNLDRADIDRITGLVIQMGRGGASGGGSAQAEGTRQ